MKAISIEQTPEEAKLAFEVHRHASIAEMRLSRAEVRARRVSGSSPVAIELSFKAKRLPSAVGALCVEVAFTMVGQAAGAPRNKTPGILVDCVYEVEYALEEGFEPSPIQIKAFKDGNAIFNAWPYFREFLQSSVQRMGLPPLVVPFLRLQPKKSTIALPAKRATNSIPG